MVHQEGQTDFLDLLVNTLREHEVALSEIVDRLEKLLAGVQQGPGKDAVISERDFVDVVGDILLTLPKGYDFCIPKVTHTAYVKIERTEPNSCSKTLEK